MQLCKNPREPFTPTKPMRIPVLQGVIDRRILVNFSAEPDVVAKLIPSPFCPKIYREKAVVGICLIRLKHVRPAGFPAWLGISSENGAHRIAVEWAEEDGQTKQGVFIPRRDTSSLLNHLAGQRVFPGRHHRARFLVHEEKGRYQVAFTSDDGTSIALDARKADTFTSKIFPSLSEASRFFEGGAVGFSPSGSDYEGLELRAFSWNIEPLHVSAVQSSFFENEFFFPKDSIQFDNALLMTKIAHEWHSVGRKRSCV